MRITPCVELLGFFLNQNLQDLQNFRNQVLGGIGRFRVDIGQWALVPDGKVVGAGGKCSVPFGGTPRARDWTERIGRLIGTVWVLGNGVDSV